VPYSAPTPPPPDSNDDFEPWELATIKAEVAAFLSTNGRLRWHDSDDLDQECRVHWMQKRQRFDASRGANIKTFLKRVVRNRLKDIRDEELAQKRGSGRQDRSLDELLPSDDGGDSTLADFLSDDNPDADPLERALRSELGFEILRITYELKPLQQDLINGLLDGQKISDISAALEVPRSTLYDELKRIRAEFERRRLREFLD
jgi:RNA polymerase sigma factor (sigma-70 family)